MFPDKDRVLDGFGSHGPGKQFPANGYGLYDMTGNVREWVNEWYAPDYFRRSPVDNPRGPALGTRRSSAAAAGSARRTIARATAWRRV